ncbi:MAG: hypothetical protein WCK80_03510 [bacterium]
MSKPDDAALEQVALDRQPIDVATGDIEKQQAVKELGTKDSKDLSIEVKVHSPYKVYYEGQAFSISAENDTGPFDILPKHDNFICLLKACNLVLRTVKDGEQSIEISGGVMHAKADKVIVFLDI